MFLKITVLSCAVDIIYTFVRSGLVTGYGRCILGLGCSSIVSLLCRPVGDVSRMMIYQVWEQLYGVKDGQLSDAGRTYDDQL